MSASRKVTVFLSFCCLSPKGPRPNPAICWLHPGEQKLMMADDPEHAAFLLFGKYVRRPPAALSLILKTRD